MSYILLNEQVKNILSVDDGLLSSACNVTALLWHALEDINWLGFYYVDETSNCLRLGPFQGQVACTQIAYGKGVCGTAWETGEIQRVEDVHAFPGHIACDQASNSEIVLPLKRNGQVFAVLDIDSPSYGRFRPADEEGLKRIQSTIEDFLQELMAPL